MAEEISQEVRNQILDEEHLRLLSIGHYIAGGFTIAISSFLIFYFFLFLLVARRPDLFGGQNNGHPPPAGIFNFVAIILGLLILAGWTFGGLTIYVGRCIKRRVRRTLTLVIASLNTLSMPFGTVLAVFTLMVITRPSVKLLYSRAGTLVQTH
jgi:fatty acid desaturase